MKEPLEIVSEFIRLTNDDKDVESAVELMADNIKFIGPAMMCNGKLEYKQLLKKFLPMHTGWEKHQAFEKNDEVCFIEDIHVLTPQGKNITLQLAEWFKVSNGKIREHKVFYDPREFMNAFGMN